MDRFAVYSKGLSRLLTAVFANKTVNVSIMKRALVCLRLHWFLSEKNQGLRRS
jgi:hypothetical protein